VSSVWKWWTKRKEAKERRAELEALAQATAAEVRTAVKEVVAELAGDRPPAEQARLEAYLLAVPAQLRRTLRRPSDTSGRTVPPDLVLAREEDLVPLLPARAPRFTAGDRVADFELVELLGVGGFGEVWKARNVFMPGTPPVALKFCIDANAAASLRQETALLDRIQWEGTHPGIVQLRHTFLSAEPPFLEYELVEGGDLGGLIVEWHRQKGGPTPAEAARLIQRLAEIVAFAHARGIIHRDLKPANILVQGEIGSAARLKIADFGIGAITADTAYREARLTGAMSTRTAAAACGGYSLYYASPEQTRGAAADPRDDVHALGVVWYQLLIGDLTAEAPRGPGWKKRLAAKGMSAELIELLEACLASDREDRPANATEVAEQIELRLAPSRPTALGQPAPVPALPPEPLDQVIGSVAEKMRHYETEKRQKKFLEVLRALRAALGRLAPKSRWTVRNVATVLATLALSGIVGAVGAVGTESLVLERNRSFNAEEAARIARARSTTEITFATAVTRHGNEEPFHYWDRSTSDIIRVTVPDSDYLWIKVDLSGIPGGTFDRSFRYGNYLTLNPGSKEPLYTPRQSGGQADLKREAAAALGITLNREIPALAAEYASVARPTGRSAVTALLSGFGSGLLALGALVLGLTYFRRARAGRWTRTVEAAIARLETEFPVDTAEYRKHVDLRDLDAVRELITQLERHSAPRE
jgi:serine/threonine protein kinase